MKKKLGCCKDCQYYWSSGLTVDHGSSGECMRYPPKPDPSTLRKLRPQVSRNTFCGEFLHIQDVDWVGGGAE